MHLVQIFLPLADNEGNQFDRGEFKAVEDELFTRFAGLTAYPRAPASGVWESPQSGVRRDDTIVYEIMVERLEIAWWGEFRRRLEASFRQEQVLVRAQMIDLL